MAKLEEAVIQFNTGTAIVGTKINIVPGFEAKAIFAFLTGRTEAVDTVGRANSHGGVGMAVSPTSRAVAATFDADSVGSTDTRAALRADGLVHALTTGGASDGRLDLDIINPLNFDLIVDEVFGASYRVLLWILGGDAITGASIVNYQSPSPTGNQAVTGFGLTPDIYFLLGIGEDFSLPQSRNGARISFSAAVSAAQRACSAFGSESGKATSKTRHYALDVEDYAGMKGNTDVNERADHVSMDVDGFTQNWLETENRNDEIFALAIQGGNWAIKPILTVADIITSIPITGLIFEPSGGLIVSGCDVENVADAEVAPNRISYGAWDSPTSRGAHGIFSGDSLGTTDVSEAVEHDAVFVRIGSSATTQGIMDIVSRDALGATFIMDEADSAPHFAFGIFGGPFTDPGAPAAPTLLAVTCVAFNQIDLAWVDNAIDEDNYEIQRETPIAGGFIVIATIAADSTAFSDTTVLPGTQYNYRVRAKKILGPTFSGFSNVDDCITPMPPSGGGMTTVEGPTGPLTRVVG